MAPNAQTKICVCQAQGNLWALYNLKPQHINTQLNFQWIQASNQLNPNAIQATQNPVKLNNFIKVKPVSAKPSQEDHVQEPWDMKLKSLIYIYIYTYICIYIFHAKQTQELTGSIDPRTMFFEQSNNANCIVHN